MITLAPFVMLCIGVALHIIWTHWRLESLSRRIDAIDKEPARE